MRVKIFKYRFVYIYYLTTENNRLNRFHYGNKSMALKFNIFARIKSGMFI